MSNPSPNLSSPVPWFRRGITYVIVLVIGLAVGFVPMWIRYRACANLAVEATSEAGLVRADTVLASAEAAQELTLVTIQNTLASAAIDAQRGDYELASQEASAFFTALRDEANKGSDSSLSQSQKNEVEGMFAGRDELIALLARNDPAAQGRLSDLYASLRELLSN